jgi:molybdenum-dependent DNA-binding transcriptional regulator ModE
MKGTVIILLHLYKEYLRMINKNQTMVMEVEVEVEVGGGGGGGVEVEVREKEGEEIEEEEGAVVVEIEEVGLVVEEIEEPAVVEVEEDSREIGMYLTTYSSQSRQVLVVLPMVPQFQEL